ncbi:CLUMA_CG007402, isoform A [Clunio marinus]|uniref:CLUMA_CG007402, isoform A n=1 Tax=Clunio marinus TaxID=568069 RepID=A0A1J1I0Z6_9DIPT|nr:CLUMA_CG007402, isoform A [Clunio marinus]
MEKAHTRKEELKGKRQTALDNIELAKNSLEYSCNFTISDGVCYLKGRALQLLSNNNSSPNGEEFECILMNFLHCAKA